MRPRAETMKPIVLALTGAALTGIVTVEMWHLSGQRFWLFCALLLFVGEALLLSATVLGDRDATKALGWRFCGFSDWAAASVFVAVAILALVACSTITYQLVSLPPSGACAEICLP